MITSVEEFESMVTSDDISLLRAGVTDCATPEVWFAILAKRPDLAGAVAMNKQLPTSVIDVLIVNPCSRARSLIAMKRRLTADQFERLSRDPDESVRALVASNVKAPLEVIERLADDAWEMVAEHAIRQLSERRIGGDEERKQRRERRTDIIPKDSHHP